MEKSIRGYLTATVISNKWNIFTRRITGAKEKDKMWIFLDV